MITAYMFLCFINVNKKNPMRHNSHGNIIIIRIFNQGNYPHPQFSQFASQCAILNILNIEPPLNFTVSRNKYTA